MTTRVNSEVKRSQEPQKKGLTKAEAERRTAHGAVLPVGAAGQRLVSFNNARCCKLLAPCCIFSPILIHFYVMKMKCLVQQVLCVVFDVLTLTQAHASISVTLDTGR